MASILHSTVISLKPLCLMATSFGKTSHQEMLERLKRMSEFGKPPKASMNPVPTPTLSPANLAQAQGTSWYSKSMSAKLPNRVSQNFQPFFIGHPSIGSGTSLTVPGPITQIINPPNASMSSNPNFQIGQAIELTSLEDIDSDQSHTLLQIGERYTIISDDGGHNIRILLDGAGPWWINKKHFRPSEVKKPSKAETFDLNDLVAADEVKKEIKSVISAHKHFGKIFDEWGLGEAIPYGRGQSLLFWGPPGTGKTHAANIIANDLSRELLVISPAEVQSSEPGGANRAIQNAFKKAKVNNMVLFIDECDGLITNRANVGMIIGGEINTLLTELEKFEGVVVFATNRIETLDPAMERRLSAIIHFPLPNHALRMKLWERFLSKKMPLDKAVTAEWLADYALSGGEIKNIVLGAARRACMEEAKKVTREHFQAVIDRTMLSKSKIGSQPAHNHKAIWGRGDTGPGVGTSTSIDKTKTDDVEVDKVKVKVKKETNEFLEALTPSAA